jgi:LemA protein
MKNKGLLIFGAILLILFFWGCSQYNGLVKKDETVNKSWNNVQTVYQKRADEINNLVNTVKGAAKFEQETLTKVIEARAKATQVTMNTKDLTPENIAKVEAAQSELKGSLNRLLVTVEQYPDLKANQNFMSLQKSISDIEGEVRNARRDFNEEIRGYNTSVRSFPVSVFAGMFGFSKREGFKAEEGTEKAPKVDVDISK